MARTYDLALIPCTKMKNPMGVTPVSLYRSSPFSITMRHAQQRCGRVLIMSAKYGLLDLTDRVAYYDWFIATLTEEQRVAMLAELQVSIEAKRILNYEPPRVLSYLPALYFQTLAELTGWQWAMTVHRPYKTLPSLTMMKVLANETKGFGTTGLARR